VEVSETTLAGLGDGIGQDSRLGEHGGRGTRDGGSELICCLVPTCWQSQRLDWEGDKDQKVRKAQVQAANSHLLESMPCADDGTFSTSFNGKVRPTL